MKKTLKNAFTKYLKATLDARFGTGKSPERKTARIAMAGDTGIMGKDGFLLKEVLANVKDFDYYHAPEKLAPALEGKSAIVVGQWTGATTVTFHIFEDGVKAKKY